MFFRELENIVPRLPSPLNEIVPTDFAQVYDEYYRLFELTLEVALQKKDPERFNGGKAIGRENTFFLVRKGVKEEKYSDCLIYYEPQEGGGVKYLEFDMDHCPEAKYNMRLNYLDNDEYELCFIKLEKADVPVQVYRYMDSLSNPFGELAGWKVVSRISLVETKDYSSPMFKIDSLGGIYYRPPDPRTDGFAYLPTGLRYEGCLNDKLQLHGKGKLTDTPFSPGSFEGIFKNGQPHIGRWYLPHGIIEGEQQDTNYNGEDTVIRGRMLSREGRDFDENFNPVASHVQLEEGKRYFAEMYEGEILGCVRHGRGILHTRTMSIECEMVNGELSKIISGKPTVYWKEQTSKAQSSPDNTSSHTKKSPPQQGSSTHKFSHINSQQSFFISPFRPALSLTLFKSGQSKSTPQPLFLPRLFLPVQRMNRPLPRLISHLKYLL